MGLANHIEENGLVSGSQPGDMLTKDYLSYRMFSTARPLVQHIRAVSTGQGGTSMDKTLFLRPLISLSAPDWGSPPESIICTSVPWSDGLRT